MARIMLYDEIGPGFYGLLDGKWMVDELDKAKGEDVELRINSPGGSVFEAQAMVTAIRAYRGKVTAYIDALAASAASFVAIAAAEVVIAENAMIMIHNAWGVAIGNAGDLRKRADLLDKIDQQLVDQYVAKTGKDRKQIEEWMAAETWMTGTEAFDRGFADRLVGAMPVKACVRDGMYAHVPPQIAAGNAVSPRVAIAAQARRLALARACQP